MYKYIYVCIYIYLYIYLYIYIYAPAAFSGVPCNHCRQLAPRTLVNDSAVTNIVWYVSYKGGVGGGAYVAQWSCNIMQ